MSETLELERSVTALPGSRIASYIELTKPRIASLVLVATGFGVFLAAGPSGIAAMGALMLHAVIGTGLVAGGANALNQYLEASLDAQMKRTADRPIPSGRLSSRQALTFGLVTSLGGLVYLLIFTNPVAALVGATALGSYVLIYTPLKQITTLCVFVGAFSGALPPVIGWVAGAGFVGREAWLLFLIVFFWQLPHFTAIAWLYRSDYRQAGYQLLQVLDQQGTRTNLHMMTLSVALVAATLLPAVFGFTGAIYAFGAMALGLGFIAMGVVFVFRKTVGVARCHLLTSVSYLPTLFTLMAVDRVYWLS